MILSGVQLGLKRSAEVTLYTGRIREFAPYIHQCVGADPCVCPEIRLQL